MTTMEEFVASLTCQRCEAAVMVWDPRENRWLCPLEDWSEYRQLEAARRIYEARCRLYHLVPIAGGHTERTG